MNVISDLLFQDKKEENCNIFFALYYVLSQFSRKNAAAAVAALACSVSVEPISIWFASMLTYNGDTQAWKKQDDFEIRLVQQGNQRVGKSVCG